MSKETASIFDSLMKNPLFTADEKIEKKTVIDLSSLNKGSDFIQTFSNSKSKIKSRQQRQRNLEPKLKKKIATVKFKNKFLTKTNFYENDVQIENVQMTIEENAKLIQDQQ